jgi:hypothetical protein
MDCDLLGPWHSEFLETPTASAACLPVPSRQSCTPLLCRLLSPEHTFFSFQGGVPSPSDHEQQDTPFEGCQPRRPCSSRGAGGIGSPPGGVHGLEEVQHGVSGHRRLLRLRRCGQAGVPGRQLLAAAEALRRRAAAHGWAGHAAPLPQATGHYYLLLNINLRIV